VRQIDAIAKRGNQALHQELATTFRLRRSAASWVVESIR
jgi:hypothetical protein